MNLFFEHLFAIKDFIVSKAVDEKEKKNQISQRFNSTKTTRPTKYDIIKKPMRPKRKAELTRNFEIFRLFYISPNLK